MLQRQIGNESALENGPVVCSCFAVGRSALLRAIRGDQLASVEQIGKALNAGTNCGSCIPELNAFDDDFGRGVEGRGAVMRVPSGGRKGGYGDKNERPAHRRQILAGGARHLTATPFAGRAGPPATRCEARRPGRCA